MVAREDKRSLFGGALRGAGLAAAMTATGPAMAEFVPVAPPPGYANYLYNYALDAAQTEVIDDLVFNFTADLTGQLSNGNAQDGYLNAYANAFSMGAYATSYPSTTWSQAGAVVWQHFTVTDNKPATVYWDFTNGNISCAVSVYQFGVGDIMIAGPFSSGSQVVNLVAGESYIFIAQASIPNPNGGSLAYAYIINGVPAPGALAALAVGMLGVKRRRRD